MKIESLFLFIVALIVAFPISNYGDVAEDSPTSLTISGSASDIDGDQLTFSIVDKLTSGTDWLVMSEDGSISGTPTNEDVGENKWAVRVVDGHGGSDEATLVINVINTNDPPELNFPLTSGTINQGDLIDINLNDYVSDVDPTTDTITVSMISGPKWITLNSFGRLLGIPSFNNVGTFNLVLRVKDNHDAFTETRVSMTVDNKNITPVVNEIIFYNEF